MKLRESVEVELTESAGDRFGGPLLDRAGVKVKYSVEERILLNVEVELREGIGDDFGE